MLTLLFGSQAHPKVADKLKGLIKAWAVEFSDDPQLRYSMCCV